eukprot:1829876-Prymnesium_polylepis.2
MLEKARQLVLRDADRKVVVVELGADEIEDAFEEHVALILDDDRNAAVRDRVEHTTAPPIAGQREAEHAVRQFLIVCLCVFGDHNTRTPLGAIHRQILSAASERSRGRWQAGGAGASTTRAVSGQGPQPAAVGCKLKKACSGANQRAGFE